MSVLPPGLPAPVPSPDGLDTPYWRDCRDKTDLAGAARIVDWFKENGPSTLVKGILIPESNSFGFEGYLAMLVGQRVQYNRERKPPAKEMQLWHERTAAFAAEAKGAMNVFDGLRALRMAGWIK